MAVNNFMNIKFLILIINKYVIVIVVVEQAKGIFKATQTAVCHQRFRLDELPDFLHICRFVYYEYLHIIYINFEVNLTKSGVLRGKKFGKGGFTPQTKGRGFDSHLCYLLFYN